MGQSHDTAVTPLQSPPTTSPIEVLPARPNGESSAFSAGIEPGVAAAQATLAGHALGSFYYESFVQDPRVASREALFTAYVGDWPGYEAMVSTVRRAALAEERAGSTRPEQLRALPAGIEAGLLSLRTEPEPFELDILLGLLEAGQAPTLAAFLEAACQGELTTLLQHLEARAADPETVAQLHAALGSAAGEASSWLKELAVETLMKNAGFAAQELSSQFLGVGDGALDRVADEDFQVGRGRADLFDIVRGAAEVALGLTVLGGAATVTGVGGMVAVGSGGLLAVPAGGVVATVDAAAVVLGGGLVAHGGLALMSGTSGRAGGRGQGSPIEVRSKIDKNSYARRHAESLSDQAQRDVDHLVERLQAGAPDAGMGCHPLGDNFYELRGANCGRVIVKKVHKTLYDVVGKFQAHVRGDAANSEIIRRLKDGYVE